MVSAAARPNVLFVGLRRRPRMPRVTLSMICGDVATSSSNIIAENAASVVSRTARTVADRGARSSSPSSPTTSPRPSSAISCSPCVAVVDQHRQPTTDDEVGGIRDVALTEERVAGFESTPRHTIDHLLNEVVVAAAHQLGHHRGHVRTVDALAGLVGHAVGHLGVAVQERLELRPFDLEHLDRPTRSQRGGAKATGDHRHLADHLPCLDRADDHLAQRRRLRCGDGARLDEVDVVGGIALFDEDVTVGERQRIGRSRPGSRSMSLRWSPITPLPLDRASPRMRRRRQ